eukprot:TRINITY_DN8984_c0_g1_i2.p1 TRINITY_DN8984_c0_g1~~TRINITY_DN8984_c0_g1_i2.p1  ORF type:complete len:315 (-),score=44.23 TRINITY_DN8984_c0_g1_i2:69-1013(-)
MFSIRIAIFLALMWTFLAVLVVSLIILPVAVGRTTFGLVGMWEMNDIYTTLLGFYLLWGVGRCVRVVSAYIGEKRFMHLLERIWFWMKVCCKCGVLLFFWIGVIPLLIGVFFEMLIVMPIRVPANISPCSCALFQDYALGLFSLKLWFRIVMLGPASSLKEKFEQIKREGFSDIHTARIFRQVILPICKKLALVLALPYFVAKAIVPMLTSSVLAQSALYRLSYMLFVTGFLCIVMHRIAVKWVEKLRSKILDDKYLIGRNLENCAENIPSDEETEVEALEYEEEEVEMDLHEEEQNLPKEGGVLPKIVEIVNT